MLAHWKQGALVCLVSLATTGSARAYTIENAFSAGCHERITAQALHTVRADLRTARPRAANENEQALIDDVQFVPDEDMRDLGGATLLLGARDNDLKGRGANDLSELAQVHGDPNAQREHCLRSSDQIEPGGSDAAMKECRAFIHQRVAEALDGLDASGEVDLFKRADLPVHLSLRGSITASLPTFYVRMGQALHAVEDSFAHTYRTPDGMKVTVVLNWVDSVQTNFDESRSGPAHIVELDRCDDPDDRRRVRHQLATEAVTGILRASLDPSLPRDTKLGLVDATLDKYLGYQAGCTWANHWCDAPEAAYKPRGCGCGVPTTGTEGREVALSALLLGGLAFVRRASKRPPGRFNGNADESRRPSPARMSRHPSPRRWRRRRVRFQRQLRRAPP
jgi:MYXO-CTERM domain-containing protein